MTKNKNEEDFDREIHEPRESGGRSATHSHFQTGS
jgi:hypothetical protein